MLTRAISAAWVRGIRETIKAAGLDAAKLFSDAGLNIADLDKPEAWFAPEKISLLWELAAERSGNPALALSLPDAYTLASLDEVGFVMMSSPNLLTALRRSIRYMHIVSRAAHVELLEEKGGYAFKLKIYEGARQVPRQRAEYVLANVVKQCRWISGRSIRPTAVHFVYPAPANREPYVNFFQCPLHFGASVYAVHFSRDDLTLPLPNFNPTLSEMHERFAMEHLNRLESGSISYRIRDLIVKQLPDGDPSRIDIAKALHVSERTLQRRLQDEGIAFSELVDNTRRELADEYLKQSKMTLSQIAYLLGFRTQSTFFRACKRWFGMPPSEYREQT